MAGLAHTAKRARPPKAAQGGGDPATRQRVIDAAVSCILELGFYRASSNAIARQAGVTWGVIQHYFGTRERLMLEVLRNGTDRFCERMTNAVIDATEPQERLEQFIDVLAGHYGTPEHLAYLQILLNLDQDPGTSDDIRETMRTTGARSAAHVERLIRETLGQDGTEKDGAIDQVVFMAVQGFLVTQQLRTHLAYDYSSARQQDKDTDRKRLAALIATALDE